MPALRVGLAQINPVVGDLPGNAARMRAVMVEAEALGCDLLAFPELAITGYPPEDLLLRPSFVEDAREALESVIAASGRCLTVAGFVEQGPAGQLADSAHYESEQHPKRANRSVLYNSAAVFAGGESVAIYRKRKLPNYSVFDEQRYFTAGSGPLVVVEVSGVKVGISICEDAWAADGPIAALGAEGVSLVVNINASPYNSGKSLARSAVIAERAREANATVVYVNQVGGQDELVFDGDSFVMSADGTVTARAPQFVEGLFVVDVEFDDAAAAPAGRPAIVAPGVAPTLGEEEEIWNALVLGTRDFVRKNGFTDVVIGLSGGIDSALVAAIAVDALGAGHVHGVLMPSRYSSGHSISDAVALAENLGIDHRTIAIEPAHASLMGMLEPSYEGHEIGLAEENLQSRIRAVLLMGLSNAFGWMLLNTGNKSESSVGYSTLYGDTAGGYAVIKDVSKLLVYRLCRHRNVSAGREIIPESVLSKPPSAELRPDQRDDQSLPPYEILDPILALYVEGDLSAAEIVALGHDAAIVDRIVGLVDLAEYKRRQSPPGPRVTSKGFGKDRRLPIVNRYRR